MKRTLPERMCAGIVDVMATAGVVFLVVPLVVIVPMSFGSSLTLEFPPKSWSISYYVTFFSRSAWLEAARNTFEIGLTASFLATAVSIPAAYALTQSSIRGKFLIRFAVMLPLTVPLIVVAVAAYSTFAPLGFSDNILSLSLVHAALGTPLAFIAVNASFELFDQRLSQAAASLGATPLRTFLRVVIPAVLPGVATGALFAFVYSFNEAVVAIFLGGPNSETLPRKMWEGIILQVDPIISTVATLMILVTVALLVFAEVARRSGARNGQPSPGSNKA